MAPNIAKKISWMLVLNAFQSVAKNSAKNYVKHFGKFWQKTITENLVQNLVQNLVWNFGPKLSLKCLGSNLLSVY